MELEMTGHRVSLAAISITLLFFAMFCCNHIQCASEEADVPSISPHENNLFTPQIVAV